MSRRHRSRRGEETDLRLVPAAGLRLAQVGHLRVSGPQVGQVRGMLTQNIGCLKNCASEDF